MKKINISMLSLMIMTSFNATAGKQHLINELSFEFKDSTIINSKENVLPYIINGETATVEEFPFYAELVLTNGDVEKKEGTGFAHYCGGSILDSNHILTAAHCVNDLTKDEIYKHGVLINSDNHENTSIDNVYPIRNIYYHSSFNLNNELRNDIAVVEILGSFSSDKISITLPTEEQKNEYNDGVTHTEFIATGFGYIDDSQTTPILLQKAAITSKTDVECSTLVSNKYSVTYYDNEQICSLPKETADDSGEYTGVCNGDSGGPLMTFTESTETEEGGYQQIGIVSYGAESSCSDPTAAQVFTEIYNYNDWITTILNHEELNRHPKDTIKISRYDDNVFGLEDDGSSGGSTGFFGLIGLALLGLRRKIKK